MVVHFSLFLAAVFGGGGVLGWCLYVGFLLCLLPLKTEAEHLGSYRAFRILSMWCCGEIER